MLKLIAGGCVGERNSNRTAIVGRVTTSEVRIAPIPRWRRGVNAARTIEEIGGWRSGAWTRGNTAKSHCVCRTSGRRGTISVRTTGGRNTCARVHNGRCDTKASEARTAPTAKTRGYVGDHSSGSHSDRIGRATDKRQWAVVSAYGPILVLRNGRLRRVQEQRGSGARNKNNQDGVLTATAHRIATLTWTCLDGSETTTTSIAAGDGGRRLDRDGTVPFFGGTKFTRTVFRWRRSRVTTLRHMPIAYDRAIFELPIVYPTIYHLYYRIFLNTISCSQSWEYSVGQ